MCVLVALATDFIWERENSPKKCSFGVIRKHYRVSLCVIIFTQQRLSTCCSTMRFFSKKNFKTPHFLIKKLSHFCGVYGKMSAIDLMWFLIAYICIHTEKRNGSWENLFINCNSCERGENTCIRFMHKNLSLSVMKLNARISFPSQKKAHPPAHA